MVRRYSSRELGEMFGRSQLTVARDLRRIKEHPYFADKKYSVLGGGTGVPLTCPAETYQVFLEFRRFFVEGDDWKQLEPLADKASAI